MAAQTVFSDIDDLRSRVGDEIAVGDWLEIAQDDVDRFADVTGDHQWIHVDPERAKTTPFGGTIVHGFFTLALSPALSFALWRVENAQFILNYGLNRVRFPAPLKVGSRVRVRVALDALDDIAGGAQATFRHTFEAEGGDKPVCVADWVLRIQTG